MANQPPSNRNRSIRVFVSSTFRDMVEERNELMLHTWPALRRLCRERQVEFVEVDLRWGIPEAHSTRHETLTLCLNEIRACRPYFIGLVGERYGWVPGPEAMTADLREEQPWLAALTGASVTELEILHGVLNNPEMAGRAFFYLRDPAYAQARGPECLPESAEAAVRQTNLKAAIRKACAEQPIPLRENYPDPRRVAEFIVEDLQAAIEADYPKEAIPDPLTREAREHEAFAEVRRRTYIGRPDYYDALDRHAMDNGGPLLLLGDSGGGKSALLANWLARWRQSHPEDFIVEHYIGSTPDSADHWRLMRRLIEEIKRWTDDPEEVPHSHDDLLKTFPIWLAKARSRAEHTGIRCILVLDALNQLEDQDRARLLGWLPAHPFTGPLRLITSTLPGETLEAIESRGWATLHVEPLTADERRRMIAAYLKRFSKTLDDRRIERLASAPAAANPLYLKILLDQLRVTGTHERLDERLREYLAASDIPALLKLVLARYQRDYERDRPGLVGEALGLIWAARRGLSESELRELLRPADQPQLPQAIWAPLRAALEDLLVDRGGILNFAHDYLWAAVELSFAPDEDQRDDLRLRLADYFEAQPISARSCDELPWLLWQTKSFTRLRACLLDIERFLKIHERHRDELMRYWVGLGEERTMGKAYLDSFESWAQSGHEDARIRFGANQLGYFLNTAALYAEAESLVRRALANDERSLGTDHFNVARDLNSLATLLQATNRLAEAEPLMRRALAIDERILGTAHPEVAIYLNNLAQLLQATNRLAEAEPLIRRALAIDERSLGADHPNVARGLNNLAQLLMAANRLTEAEPLLRRALAIDERSLGTDHFNVARDLNNLAALLHDTNRSAEAEPLIRRALAIDERSLGTDHPTVAIRLNNLAQLLLAANRLAEAEPLIRRALAIDERSLGTDHPKVARDLNHLAQLLQTANRLAEAEPLIRRALAIDERSLGADHPNVTRGLNNLATVFQATNRLAEAEPLYRRALAIAERSLGTDDPMVASYLNNLAQLLQDTNRLAEAELLMRRALAIDERSYGVDHPDVAIDLNNLATLLQATNRLAEAEPLMRRTLAIGERSLGFDHPKVATRLTNLATLLQATNRSAEAEILMRRHLESFLEITRVTGHSHPHLQTVVNTYARLLGRMGHSPQEVLAQLNAVAKPYGIQLGNRA